MQIYTVGGAVRDELLGLPVQDRDYVVVGATPEQMLAQGYRPVGKDFPVFLHPQTQEEYALARTERKTAPGYRGFVFHTDSEVTLEQDLARRDLTINAIAKGEDGVLIDPFDGQADLHERVFRHVSPAFVEDPVRILRVARFAARFVDFRVAPETNALMQDMVRQGEVDALVPERVWQELARGMMEQKPSRMFAVLRACGALARILPELDALWGVPQPARYHPEIDTGVHVMMVLDYAAARAYSMGVRLAALFHDLGKGTTSPALWPSHHGHEGRSVTLVEGICARLKIPNDYRDLALITAREHGNVGRAFELRPATIVDLITRCDGWRKPQRFDDMLLASECDRRGRTGFEEVSFDQRPYLLGALQVAQAVDAGAIAGRLREQPQRIPEAILAARIAAVKAYVEVANQQPTLQPGPQSNPTSDV
ncbi:tRNA nucleotidyltransferase (CCA-adding enzyme) [Herbaspirillum sp. Sphag1AN]|uniref:multifunctional CCA addition/repair protein n=1 Tax=unclassified Herbaspirillum TaxID=2624150 RepID=UPI00161694DC|nr:MULTISPECIES: multifunctional CCA addition/repair protein [unclassified Herbaspirillum]MBB3212528.1 tRNA nucleotidyltransferase (CCA-adding enzyme) [Herbaspirillum sp. Sphag1AN]MBB3245725.1 tRNA nucleotidyltransferase (CCA-adding enzyme) [Herbaspirillum sp. Sphag64]